MAASPHLAVVNTLWIGRPLGAIERTALRSWLSCGHPVRLWVFDKSTVAPRGVELMDAAEILPASSVYAYANGSVSAWSNAFRFELLLRRGGVWVDADVVCLKPMPWLSAKLNPVVIAGERARDGTTIPTTHLLKMPAGSEVARACVAVQREHRDAIRRGTMRWGSGPAAVAEAVRRCGLHRCVLPWWRTASCPPEAARTLIGEACGGYPTTVDALRPGTHCLHLWHEQWRRAGVDAARVPPGSIFGKLRAAHDARV